ncbi:glycosyltransferase [Acidobacteriota bacterium]
MKICVLSFHCCPLSPIGGEGVGGMNVYLKELCSALANDPNTEIDIFTRAQNPGMSRIKRMMPNVRVIHLPAGPECFIDRKSLYDYLPEFVENLKGFMSKAKKNYDVIYTHYWLSGLAGEYLKHYFGLPLVHTYHTLAFLKNRVSNEHEQRNRLLAERHLSFAADLIISSSSEEKINLIREYGISAQKIRVIYPGVNQNLFYPSKTGTVYRKSGFSEDHQILLYVGRVEPIKGLLTVIKALALINHSDHPLSEKLKLIIIGGGKEGTELSQNIEVSRVMSAVKAFGLSNKIVFLGSIEQTELKNYYSTADALMVPSLYESFGLVVVEALACGTPVLVSNVGKMRTIVKEGKNGYSFAPGSPESLKNKLVEFSLKKDHFWEKEKIRRDIIERFSWDKTERETRQVFASLKTEKILTTTIFRRDESPQPA